MRYFRTEDNTGFKYIHSKDDKVIYIENETAEAPQFSLQYGDKLIQIFITNDGYKPERDIVGTPDLFTLSYRSDMNDKGQYILATEAEINIYEDDFFNIDELKTVGETDILIKYFEYDELVWQGFALPDFFQTGITKPRALRIVATDRIGVLKDIANTSVSNTPKGIIEECLLQTGLTLPIEIRNKNSYIETTTINRERIEGVSAYDVIRAFMVQFNSKIVQYKNKWWIVNKKLLEDGFLNQEIIDIDLVYLDGQREIKPTASDVSLYLEYGGSKKYSDNWNFEEWDDATNTFDGWYNHNEVGAPMVQRKGEYYVDSYVKVPGMDYTWDAVFSERKLNTPALWSRNRYFEYTYGDRMDRKPQLRSPFAPVRIEGERAEITLKIDYTTMMRENMHLVFSPIIKILNSDDTTKRWWIIDGKGGLISGGSESYPRWAVFNFDNYLRVAPTYVSADNGTPVQDLFETTYNIDKAQLQISEGGYAEIQLAWFGYFEPKSTNLHNWIDVFLHSVEFIFNKSEFTGKGLIFKTKQGGDKFSKVRETETALFSDKINQGVNGYFYNYKYDDTSITNLPKEYLLEMTQQMADMFCSARDFYSIGGKFKVNPLARYRCGNKYFVLVGGQSKRKTASIEIEEIVSNPNLIRTDYIYTYFEDSKDNIKSIGTASGGGGGSGGGSGGGMTADQITMLTNLADWWKLDEENDAIYSEKSVYSLKGVSALGLGPEGGGGGGDFDRLDRWVDYDSSKAGWVLSAFLGKDLDTRVNALQSGSATNIEISGSGNAVTGVSKDGNTLTFAKGSTFSLSTHNHDTIYKPIGYEPSWGDITGKPTTFAPSAHTHTIANVTDLQTALNGKEPSFTKNTAFNKNFGTTAGTVAQGDDSRINNGQTAFGWGNHASAGYALNSALTAHINKVDNPHAVTKAQVGLSDVDNESKAQMFSNANLTEETTMDEAYIDFADIDFLSIPNGAQIGGWWLKQVGTELHFMHNNVVKIRMLSDGTILATGGVTALATD